MLDMDVTKLPSELAASGVLCFDSNGELRSPLVSRKLRSGFISRLQFADVARFVGISATPPKRHNSAAASSRSSPVSTTVGSGFAEKGSGAAGKPPPPLAARSQSSPSLPRHRPTAGSGGGQSSSAADEASGQPGRGSGNGRASRSVGFEPERKSTQPGQPASANRRKRDMQQSTSLPSIPGASRDSTSGQSGASVPQKKATDSTEEKEPAAVGAAKSAGISSLLGCSVAALRKQRDVSPSNNVIQLDARDEEPGTSSQSQSPKRNSTSRRSSSGENVEDGTLSAKKRNLVRKTLLDEAGSATDAFKALDLNGNHSISKTEFSSAVKSLGAMKTFKTFDVNQDGVLDMSELFPKGSPDRATVTTADFWGAWCRHGDKHNAQGERVAKWYAEDHEEELTRLLKRVQDQDSSSSERRRMKMWIRHLKSDGVSDEIVRRLCASHLPKVPRFTKEHAHKLRMRYNAKVTDSVRKVQDTVKDMREMRHSMQKFKETLSEVVDDPKKRWKRPSTGDEGGAEGGLLDGLFGSSAGATGEGEEKPPPPVLPRVVANANETEKDSFEKQLQSMSHVSADKAHIPDIFE